MGGVQHKLVNLVDHMFGVGRLLVLRRRHRRKAVQMLTHGLPWQSVAFFMLLECIGLDLLAIVGQMNKFFVAVKGELVPGRSAVRANMNPHAAIVDDTDPDTNVKLAGIVK